MQTSGAVVLITGASSGIGAAAARAFDLAGAKVALAARRLVLLEELAAEMRNAVVIPTDLSQPAQARAMVERTVEELGRVDVLINNAALIRMVRSDSLSAAEIRPSMETNLIGPMVATQAAVAVMRQNGGGHVINVGSPGYLVGLPLLAPYTASKAAFSAWTRSMQAEWADSSIQVTEFFPGHVDTANNLDTDLGTFGPEIFEDARQSKLTRWLARPQRVDEVAKQLVACVRNPRPTLYSSPSARLAAMMGLFARLRVHLASRMARSVRAHTGAAIFALRPPAELPSAAAEKGSSEKPAVRRAAATPAAGKTGRRATRDAPKRAAAANKTRAKKATKKTAKKATAKTAKKAAKKTPARKAAAKQAVAKKAPAPAVKRAAKKTVALSPDAAARVRAAAEKAAAAAGKKEDESTDS